MESWRTSFEYAFSKAVGQAIGGIVVWASLLFFLAAFALVLYLFARRRGIGVQLDFGGEGDAGDGTHRARGAANASDRSGPGESSAPPPSRELPSLERLAREKDRPSRREFLRSLDSAEQVLARIYIGALLVALLGATFLYAMLLLRYPDDGNRDFMIFYGSVVYGVGFLALTAKLFEARRRLSPERGPNLFEQLRAKVDFGIRSEPHTFSVEAEALERARRHVAAGGTLEEACEIADPRYKDLGPWARAAFRKAIELALRS